MRFFKVKGEERRHPQGRGSLRNAGLRGHGIAWYLFLVPLMVGVLWALAAAYSSADATVASRSLADALRLPGLPQESLPAIPLSVLDEIKIISTADATIASGYPNDNSGSLSEVMSTGRQLAFDAGSVRAVVKFDLSSLPSNARITKATMVLLGATNSGSPMTVGVCQMTTDWLEDGATWDKLHAARGDCYGSAEISKLAWYEFDVSALLAHWLEGKYRNYGLVLVGSDEPGQDFYAIFTTKEFGPGREPSLRIRFELPPPATDRPQWPMFQREPSHSGTASIRGPESPKVKWTFQTEDLIRSSPAVGTDGTVYIGSNDNNLYAVSPSGMLKWKFVSTFRVRSAPAIAKDGRLYFTSDEGSLYALSPEGKEEWRLFIGDFLQSSPAIGPDGTIYVGSDDGRLYAISREGQVKWFINTDDWVRSSPAIMMLSGQVYDIYVGSDDSKLYAVTPSGAIHWTYMTEVPHVHIVRSSPAVWEDAVYIGSDDGKLYALTKEGVLKWWVQTGGAIRSTPAIGRDGTIYVGSNDNSLYAINPAGKVLWSFSTSDWVQSSAAIGNDGTIYVGSDDGKLYAISPEGRQLWSVQTGDWIRSSPAMAEDGTIYIGSDDGRLYAIGGASPEDEDEFAGPKPWSSRPPFTPAPKRISGLLRGNLFTDTNGNGIKEPWEAGVRYLRVLVRGDGVSKETVTGPEGYFAIEGLPKGKYQLEVAPGQGFDLTHRVTLEVDPGEDKPSRATGQIGLKPAR